MNIIKLSMFLLILAFIIAFYYIGLPKWAYYTCSALVFATETLLLWGKDEGN